MKIEDYNEYYIQNSNHYLIPKDVFIELFNEMINWREESKELKQNYLYAVADYETTMSGLQELKKQLEEKENIACNWKDSCLENAGKIEKLENQQKEFIKYLEDKIYSIEPKGTGINYNCEYDSEEDYISAMQEQSRLNTLKEILLKYKEIIGGKDE